METSVDQVSDFLLHLQQQGKAVNTIKNYRAAISAVHSRFPDQSSVGTNTVISQVIRAIFHRTPSSKRLAPSWSINDVLATLAEAPYEPLGDAPLELLTHKTLFLVAVASARRRGCLHALSVRPGFMRFEPAGVRLIPNPEFLAKNQTESFTPEEIFLPTIDSVSTIREDKRWCPVRALKWYVDKTKHLRTSDRLFILPGRPFTPAAKDTISRWIVDLIRPHSLPGESVRAHDVRSHATSRARFRGIPLGDIIRAAAWKTPSTFASVYLTDTLSAEGNFSRAALGTQRRDAPRPPSRPLC